MDFVQYAEIPEFVGRFPVAVPLRSLVLSSFLITWVQKHAVGFAVPDPSSFRPLRTAPSSVHAGRAASCAPRIVRDGRARPRALVERALASTRCSCFPSTTTWRMVVDAEGVRARSRRGGVPRAPEDGLEDAARSISDFFR